MFRRPEPQAVLLCWRRHHLLKNTTYFEVHLGISVVVIQKRRHFAARTVALRCSGAALYRTHKEMSMCFKVQGSTGVRYVTLCTPSRAMP
jgi:hypothetical protein